MNPILVLSGVCLVLLLVIAVLTKRVRALSDQLSDADFQQRSLSTSYGRITEQWFPLMEQYPYDPQGFRFLGSPIDGVQFEDDKIIFVEFKANRSQLSKGQRHFRELVESGEVYFEAFRFSEPKD